MINQLETENNIKQKKHNETQKRKYTISITTFFLTKRTAVVNVSKDLRPDLICACNLQLTSSMSQ